VNSHTPPGTDISSPGVFISEYETSLTMNHVQEEEENNENAGAEIEEEISDSVAEESTSEAVDGDPVVVETEVMEAEATPAEEVDKWKDVAARAQADLENFRKRMAREKSDAISYANQSLLEQLFPIIDNFDMGLKAARDTDGEGSVIFQGMSMVYKQIQDFLGDQGVQTIDPDGAAFDPNQHEAIKQEPSAEVPEGNVIYTPRRGYKLRDRLLRAANVVVSSGPDSEG